MDELLKAYARKRRGQGAPELHAASRKMLQDEVRRTFGNARPTTRHSVAWGWRRLVLGGCVAASVVFIFTMATFQKSPRDISPISPNFQPAPAVTAETAQTAPPATVAGGGGALPAIAAPENSAAKYDFKNTARQFVQVNNQALTRNGAAPGANVLATFQMERHGQNVLVYDGDGSIYKGKVVEPVAGSANYSFEVNGFNTALKKNVVFTGDVLQMPQSALKSAIVVSSITADTRHSAHGIAPSGAATDAITLDQQRLKDRSGENSNQIPGSLRITGKVQVGGGAFEIEARPPGP